MRKHFAFFESFFEGVHKFLEGKDESLRLTKEFYAALSATKSFVARNCTRFEAAPIFYESCEWDHQTYKHEDWIAVDFKENIKFAISPHGRFTLIHYNGSIWECNTIAAEGKPYQQLPFKMNK